MVIVFWGEEAEPTQTMKLHNSMKDFIKDTSLGGSPRLASLIKRIWWFTLSYAPSKSRKAATRTLFFEKQTRGVCDRSFSPLFSPSQE